MTEPKPQRKGRDFAIGFFGSLPFLILEFILFLGLFDNTISVFPFWAVAIGLVVATIVAFRRHRKFIGFGMLTALVAVPLLLLGSCYAIVSQMKF